MSVLQVYLSWVNSVLRDSSRSVESVAALQDGRVLCDLIDILAPGADLVAKVQASGSSQQQAYIQTALDHMKTNDVKHTLSAQDVIDGDIKSILDLMWLLILNYGIHFIGQNAYQRSVGIGKKNLLEWCQRELEVAFDHRNTLTLNLCTGNWFTKLLHKFAGFHIQESEDKVSYLYKLLQEIEERYGIHRTIISPNDIIDGTVDEHSLMIYLSLLKKRVYSTGRQSRREMFSVDGKEAAMARIEERNRSLSSEAEMCRQPLDYASSPEREEPSGRFSLQSNSPAKENIHCRSQDSGEISDWLSSSLNSLVSSKGRMSANEQGNSLKADAEQVLQQTISEKVKQHFVQSNTEDEKDTDASHNHSEKETETLSEFSSSALDEAYISTKKDKDKARVKSGFKDSSRHREDGLSRQPVGQEETARGEAKKLPEAVSSESIEDKNIWIKIKRPKDYYLQWEETMDRLSHGPQEPLVLTDMSPRSSKEWLHDSRRPKEARSLSSDSDFYHGAKSYGKEPRDSYERQSSDENDIVPYQGRRCRKYHGGSRSLSWGCTSCEQDRQDRRFRRSPSSHGKNWLKSPASYSLKMQSAVDQSKTTNRNGLDVSSGCQGKVRESLQERGSYSEIQSKMEQSGQNSDDPGSGEFSHERLVQLETLPSFTESLKTMSAQGQENLAQFDALRQARLEVDMTMPRSRGTAASGDGVNSISQLHERGKPDSDETDLKIPSTTVGDGKFMTTLRTLHNDHLSTKPVPGVGRSTDSKMSSALSEGRDMKTSSSHLDLSKHQSLSLLQEHQAAGRRSVSSSSPGDRYNKSCINPKSKSRKEYLLHSRRESPTRQLYSASGDSLSSSLSPSYETSPVGYRGSSSPVPSAYRQNDSVSFHTSPRLARSPGGSPYLGSTPDRTSPLDWLEENVFDRQELSRTGGLGRVPRREAWERQRRGHDTGVRGRNVNSLAQTKFIEVLCKEIEELKQKIEGMEEAHTDASPTGRQSNSSRGRIPATEHEHERDHNTSKISYSFHRELQETDSEMVLAPKDKFPPARSETLGSSSKYWQSTARPASLSPQPRFSARPQLSSVSHQKPQGASSEKCAFSPKGYKTTTDLLHKKMLHPQAAEDSLIFASPANADRTAHKQVTSGDTEVAKEVSPRKKFISLGYKSPIRSVMQDIWGNDLTGVEGLDPERNERYKQLIASHSLTDEEIIELKQALASAIVENDILQAKLNNARHEIQGKLSKTNEVLDDCRKHLAKSQAENMELRTSLEQQHEQSQVLEERVRELELLVQQFRVDNTELEDELDNTLALLDKSMLENKPDISTLKEKNAELQGRATVIETENSSLKKEMDDLKKSHSKAVHTVRELRECLDKVRDERNDLLQKVNSLEQSNNEFKVKAIISNYQEKGAIDEAEPESKTSSWRKSGGHQSRSHHRSSTCSDEILSGYTPSRGDTPNVSSITPCASSPSRNLSYSIDDMYPTVPSSYREIYPHRKSKYQSVSSDRYRSPDPQESPVNFITYPDLQDYPSKLDLDEDFKRRLQSPPRISRSGPATSREASPIQKPIPYRPYTGNETANTLHVNQSAIPLKAETNSPAARGRSPGRPSQSLRDVQPMSRSPGRSVTAERLNVSFSDMYDIRKRESTPSPVSSGENRKGILKNGKSFTRGSRDRSASPRFTSRSHSPPTRLAPESHKGKGSSGRNPMFSHTDDFARSLEELSKENPKFSERKIHRSKSWFELQLENEEVPNVLELVKKLSQEPIALSEDQRRYANELIKKYTGVKV